MDIDSAATRQVTQQLRALLADEIGHARVTRIRVPRNAHVYNCGDRDADLYFIEDGEVKTVTYAPSGKTCLLSIHTSGDMFGEFCLYGGCRVETAAAMRSAIVLRVPALVFCAALTNTDVLGTFLGHLALRLAEQRRAITNLVTMDSERRLAAVLLVLAGKLGQRLTRGTCIQQRITHEELSCMVGTTRSRIGYFLTRFGSAGLVQQGPGRFLVVDEGGLTSYLATAAGFTAG